MAYVNENRNSSAHCYYYQDQKQTPQTGTYYSRQPTGNKKSVSSRTTTATTGDNNSRRRVNNNPHQSPVCSTMFNGRSITSSTFSSYNAPTGGEIKLTNSQYMNNNNNNNNNPIQQSTKYGGNSSSNLNNHQDFENGAGIHQSGRAVVVQRQPSEYIPTFMLLDYCKAANERKVKELVKKMENLPIQDVDPVVNFQDHTGRVNILLS